MVRSVIAVMVVGTALACGSRGADDKDPVKEKLFAAKQTYDKEMQQYRAQAGDWFDKREETARKDGNKKALDQIKVERKAFDEDGELPKVVPTAISQKPVLAKKALEAAYGQAVKDYVKAKKDDEAAAVEKEWKTFAKGNIVDLLALVDTKVHAGVGEWKKDEKALVGTSADNLPRLQLPYEPGEEYDLAVTCRRIAGNNCIGVGLVAGGRQVLAIVDGWPPQYLCGLDTVDKKRLPDNVTAVKGQPLKADKDYQIVFSVRSGKIDIFVNGKLASSFKGDFARLSLEEGWGIANKKALFLHLGPDCSFQIDRIELTPVKGKGIILK